MRKILKVRDPETCSGVMKVGAWTPAELCIILFDITTPAKKKRI